MFTSKQQALTCQHIIKSIIRHEGLTNQEFFDLLNQ